MLQMFIAVINESFEVEESEKRQKQLEAYLRRNEPPRETFRQKAFIMLSPYGRKWEKFQEEIRAQRQRASGRPAGFSDQEQPATASSTLQKSWKAFSETTISLGRQAKKVLGFDVSPQAYPLDSVQSRRLRSSLDAGTVLSPNNRPHSVLDLDFDDFPAQGADSGRQRLGRVSRARFDLGLHANEPPTQAQIDAEYASRFRDDPRQVMARFIARYPSYDKSLFIFSNASFIRRFCQSIVPPPHGERLFGRSTSQFRFRVYQWLLFASIIASIVIAAVATPTYRKGYDVYYNGPDRFAWFVFADAMLAVLFLIELILKLVADGLIFTPNAYLLSGWNSLDLFVLVTLFVNIFAGDSRFARALKAFRALRLINLSAVMRQTFRTMFGAGLLRMMDAAVLAILYIIPFAVWGQNLFAGLLYSCNDGSSSIMTKLDCSGEYSNSPVADWTFLAPRVWGNPTEGSDYSFDDFRSSLLILFEIVSLEGWINVMTAAMSIAGKDQQLQPDNRQVNAIFFLIYNLIGAVIVLTVFVSVIIRNFRSFSGAAFLSTEQRQWIDLKRLIYRQRPSKRPLRRPSDKLRLWCYNRSVQKRGWWSRLFVVIYVLNIIALMVATYDDPVWKETLLRECCLQNEPKQDTAHYVVDLQRPSI